MEIDVLKRDYYLHSYLNGKQIKNVVIEDWWTISHPLKIVVMKSNEEILIESTSVIVLYQID